MDVCCTAKHHVLLHAPGASTPSPVPPDRLTFRPRRAEGGDDLLRLLLFWALFLPLGRCCSIDSLADRLRQPGSSRSPARALQHVRCQPGVVVSAAAVALHVQVMVMYVCNAVAKTDESWSSVRPRTGSASGALAGARGPEALHDAL